MNIEAIRLKWSKDCNIIIGQSHFIKTVEDLAEIMAVSLPKAEWGIAFNEASGPCLVRTEGTDPSLIADAVACARATGAGHSFYIVIGPGAYPINILDRVKACPEVCHIFCATGNPLELIVAAMQRLGYQCRADLYKVLDAGELAAQLFSENLPVSNSLTIVSGLAGVFSGFAKPVQRAAKQLGVDPRDVFFELGRRKVVGGQEDLILEVANELARKQHPAAAPSKNA